jgi:hypothetical protein|tara:strand:- start:92 stop:256 length:165 start_codon:yes stop_codon:yes gene_type:complete
MQYETRFEGKRGDCFCAVKIVDRAGVAEKWLFMAKTAWYRVHPVDNFRLEQAQT